MFLRVITSLVILLRVITLFIIHLRQLLHISGSYYTSQVASYYVTQVASYYTAKYSYYSIITTIQYLRYSDSYV